VTYYDIHGAREQMAQIKEFERLIETELAAVMKEDGVTAQDCRLRIQPIIDEFIDWRAQREPRQGSRVNVSIATLRNLEKLGDL